MKTINNSIEAWNDVINRMRLFPVSKLNTQETRKEIKTCCDCKIKRHKDGSKQEGFCWHQCNDCGSDVCSDCAYEFGSFSRCFKCSDLIFGGI